MCRRRPILAEWVLVGALGLAASAHAQVFRSGITVQTIDVVVTDGEGSSLFLALILVASSAGDVPLTVEI